MLVSSKSKDIPDETIVYFDAIPTGYMGAELWQPGDTVAVWGCGAVGYLP